MLYFFVEIHLEKQINIGKQNPQQTGQKTDRQSTNIQNNPRINYWMISTFIFAFLFIGLLAFNILNQTREADQNNEVLLPTTPPTISKQNVVYTASELSSIFILPNGWTKELYTKSIEPTGRGFEIYDDCNLEYCVFLENKKYIDKSNIQAYSSPVDEGRVYSYLYVTSAEKLLGEKWKSISEVDFYNAINERFPEIAKARSSEECGPYYAADKAKEITTLRYKTVLSTSYPACNYEGGKPEHIHEAYYLLLNDNDILVVRFFYDESFSNVTKEIDKFKELLSSINWKLE